LILASSIVETQPQIKHDLFPESIPSQLLQIPQSVKLEEHENPVETELVTEKGGGFLKNLYDYQGGTFIPTVDGLSNSPTSSSSAQLNTLFGVYLPCVQNIIGVIVFIRLYWVIGVSGIMEGMIIISLCCLCTFLTAISLAASKKIVLQRMMKLMCDFSCHEWNCSSRWFLFSHIKIFRSSGWWCCWIFILYR
jgi:hypothetical protein